MFNNQSAESKFNCTVVLDGTTGVKGSSEYAVFVESQARIDTIGVGSSNSLDIEARIRNTSTWTVIKTITGASSVLVDISTYDFIRFNVKTSDGLGSANGSGFITNLPSITGGGGGGGSSGDIITLGSQPTDSNNSQVVTSIIHGKTTGGGGGYVDVKVNPSGALVTESTIVSSALPTGAATEATLLSIDSVLPASIGQKTSSGSTSIVIASDQSPIEIKGYDSVGGKLLVGNAKDKIRDSFSTVDTTKWDIVTGSSDTVDARGNTAGANYVVVSKSAITSDTETIFTSKDSFTFPFRIGAGLSLSQRIIGQEFSMEFVGVDGSSIIEVNTSRPDTAVSGSITVATNVWTINTATAHGLQGLDRIIIHSSTDPRLNVGPIQVTAVTSPTQFTITSTLANATYTATNAQIRFADPLMYAKNGASYLFENTSATNASIVSRNSGSAAYIQTAQTYSSTSATQITSSPFAESFQPSGIFESYGMMDEVDFRSYSIDSLGSVAGSNKRSQAVPAIDKSYKVRFRAKNQKNLSIPVGKITAISKTGTTTATVTCPSHGLTTSDWVQIYGVRDITNFPNLTAQTQVASVVDANNFTIIIGSAVTASSLDGAVIKNHGSILTPAINFSIASIVRASNLMTITMNTTVSGLSIGNTIDVYGLTSAASAYEGAYKIRNVTGSTVVVESVGTDFGSITTGGVVFPRTDLRLHFFRVMDYLRLATEIYGGRGMSDANNSAPVVVSNTLAVSTVSTVSAVTNGNLGFPGTVADVASAALTSTTTTSAITPTYGTTYQVNIPVTAVSGTTPTLDFGIEESDDSGTNWFRVYDFPRITATGMYRSPALPMVGNRVRYVQTVAGTTPSFTRSVNRSQMSLQAVPMQRQIFDRSVTLTTLSSTTATLLSEGTRNLELEINLGAATTPPALQLQVSNDGTNWRLVGSPLTGVASSTVGVTLNNVTAKFTRAIVTTAGATVTAGYILVKAF